MLLLVFTAELRREYEHSDQSDEHEAEEEAEVERRSQDRAEVAAKAAEGKRYHGDDKDTIADTHTGVGAEPVPLRSSTRRQAF